MSLSRKSNQLLARVNFPPYTVHCLTERHILVAGGGGGAKTGIRNVIEIYELSNDGKGCRAKSVTHYETGSKAIMNCTVFHAENYFMLFAGMEGMCQLYKMKLKVEESEQIPNGFVNGEAARQATLRKRNNSGVKPEDVATKPESDVSDPVNEGSAPVNLVFDIKPLQSFQTDFSDDPFQKLVRFSCAQKLLATAGADGHIRVWKYPALNMLYEVHAHSDDVDDLDFSPLGDKIVTVSRDGCGKVWKAEDGSLICDLKCETPNKIQEKYIYRSCRFAVIEEDKSNPVLFVSLNPYIRKKPPSPCFLSKWNGQTFSMEKIVSTGNEMLSAMAVSEDGHFIGLGTQEGSVKIYIAFSLQLLYRSDHVHSIFVTGLEFMKSCEASRRITGGHEASLISISVDNHINVHYIPLRATIGMFGVIVLFTITLFMIFLLMDYFNL